MTASVSSRELKIHKAKLGCGRHIISEYYFKTISNHIIIVVTTVNQNELYILVKSYNITEAIAIYQQDIFITIFYHFYETTNLC